ncbi:MAG: hypothetical protein ACPGJS_22295 [Flammeovirgaceae bacterium]
MFEEKEESVFADFIAKIEDRISRLTTLDIKTVVGDFKYGMNEEVEPKADTEYKIMNSKINLIGGDITTSISNELMDDKFQWLLDFHARKEEKGHEIVQGNIQAILALYKLYRETRDLNYDETRVDETLFEDDNDVRG